MPGLSGPGPAYSALCVSNAAEQVDVQTSEANRHTTSVEYYFGSGQPILCAEKLITETQEE